MSNSKRVLVVDLDGTLVKTDMLLENFLSKLKGSPAKAFWASSHLVGGLASLKSKLASEWDFDPSLLPYCGEVLDYINKAKAEGRTVVLATASEESIAKRIADHLNIFDEVIASNQKKNFKGKQKLAELNERYKSTGFDYIGNASTDFPIWEQAGKALVVGARSSVVKKVKRKHQNPEVMNRQSGLKLKSIIKAIRVHQWVKNLLLFVPLLMAHKVQNTEILFSTFLAFISFSLCASSVYVLNDLLDLSADRIHPRKRNRPFASGDLSIHTGIFLFPILLGLGFVLSLFLSEAFSFVLGIYLLITTVYSFWLKQIAIVDILLLAGLFTIRIFAGGVAAGVPVSHWLLLFSMFMFLSLACAKRVSEMHTLRRRNLEEAAGRGYRASDLEQVASFGAGSGYISVLVLALYITSLDVRELYNHPEVLWLLCPVILYWVSRVWLINHRGELHDDPIVFAIKDKASYLVGALCVLLMLLGNVSNLYEL